MAIAGTWRAKQAGPMPYTGPSKWGTGVNPIHGIHAEGGSRVNKKVAVLAYPPTDAVHSVSYELVELDYGYCSEDQPNALYGYNSQTGLADRPDIGQSNEMFRASIPDESGIPYPSYGSTTTGVPSGTAIRSVSKGAILTRFSRIFMKDASPGLINKGHNVRPENATIPDDSQLVIQTSRVQRDKVRAGSQSRGRASKYDAPIPSREVGMRSPAISGGYRHDEMLPKEQTVLTARPFFPRTAGAGNPALMEPNAMYASVPRNRVPPDQPYSGVDAGSHPDNYVPGNHVYGYTDEDVLW